MSDREASIREIETAYGADREVSVMVDPTSNLGEGVTPEEAPRCATCGEPVLDNPDHRVVTWVEDGAAAHAHFCDDVCRAEWDRP